jgi:hypothetical protein
MKPIREWMRDRRVAAALAAAAVLIVGYRVVQSRDVPEESGGRAFEVAPPAPVPEDAPPEDAPPEAAPPRREARAPLRPAPAMPPGWGGPAWNWERNPFLPPSAGRIGGTAGASGEAAADPSVPRLRGTVAGGGRGSAIFRGDRPDGGDVLVPAGGAIGGWTLAAVEPYRVLLRRGKETRVIDLYRQ